jgi:alanyl-tRNA synthetase
MTERLYLADPELLAFAADVVGARVHGGRPAVLLDRTAFYPEGGGQPADHGLLGGVPVVDVQEVDGEVLHLLGGAAPAGRVQGEVDAARRRDHLQQHHGQHLLSAAFEARAGAHTVSFHLGAETSTIDLDLPPSALSPELIRAAEAAANDLVFRDLPVVARELSAAELATLPLRKEPAKGSRVVVVGPLEPGEDFPRREAIVDASPCGGTHPRRTGAVGAIAVLRAQKWAGGTRVEFVCGGRVLAALSEANRRLAAASDAFRCAPAELPQVAAKAAEEGAARRKEAEKLVGALAVLEAERLSAAAGVDPVAAVVTPPTPGAAAFVRGVAQALAARGKAAYLAAVEDGRAYLAFGRPKEAAGPHMGERLRAATAALGGKGGGTPDFAQGSAQTTDDLLAVLVKAAVPGERASESLT